MITQASSLVDVAFEVCTALDRVGVRALLVGGSAATFYTGDYQSKDADFVVTMAPLGVDVQAAVADLGLRLVGQHYEHLDSEYTIDFLGGPPGIGEDVVTTWNTVRRDDLVLHVYSRTDSVRDRLSAFYHWADVSSLRVALLVAASGSIDLAAIADWSEREGETTKFHEFADALKRLAP